MELNLARTEQPRNEGDLRGRVTILGKENPNRRIEVTAADNNCDPTGYAAVWL